MTLFLKQINCRKRERKGLKEGEEEKKKGEEERREKLTNEKRLRRISRFKVLSLLNMIRIRTR